MVDALPPIPDGTCIISHIATDMADVMLFTATELVPHSKRPCGSQGWYAGPGVEAQMNASWQQKKEARRHLRAEPHSSNLRKAVKMGGKRLRKVRKAAVRCFFWDFVRKLETRTREGDHAGFYKHLKTMNLEGSEIAAQRTSKTRTASSSRTLTSSASHRSGGFTLAFTPSRRSLTRSSQKALTSGSKTCHKVVSPRFRS